MIKKTDKNPTIKGIEKLLNRQTVVILGAVDEKLRKMELKMEEKLQRMELRIDQKIDKLTTTLDKFLKRMTDIEDEFEMMKADINRVKKVIREKLGIEII